MPILSEDQINENEEIIKNAYNCHLEIIATESCFNIRSLFVKTMKNVLKCKKTRTKF